ncbi:hypothetical protein TEA_012296 [Camellia sinensis var. sinensis]|uniref:Uncharacterized protein n=1 Tax=Camellia sinensis var. sinensis TaxID=542762 RepID=A0A4S4D4C6_CAMSN|nr:hypothetical protein TEA_012296 [Camellia sinensis var. sinensis]
MDAHSSSGDDFSVGCILSIKTTLGDEFEAQVITFDPPSNILVLQEGKSGSGQLRNIRLLKANYIESFKYLGQAEDPLDPKKFNLDLNSLQSREDSAIRQQRENPYLPESVTGGTPAANDRVRKMVDFERKRLAGEIEEHQTQEVKEATRRLLPFLACGGLCKGGDFLLYSAAGLFFLPPSCAALDGVASVLPTPPSTFTPCSSTAAYGGPPNRNITVAFRFSSLHTYIIPVAGFVHISIGCIYIDLVIHSSLSKADDTTNELYQLASVAFCLLSAWCSDKLGLSLELGSFVAGVMISTTDFAQHTLDQVEPIRNLFTALFLSSIGMLIHVQFLWIHVDILLASVILVVVVKTTVVAMVTKAFGYSTRTSFMIGVLLAQIGEFAFVLLSRASNLRLIEGKMYLLLLGTTALSLVTTPVLFKLIPAMMHLGALMHWFPAESSTQNETTSIRRNQYKTYFDLYPEVGFNIQMGKPKFGVPVRTEAMDHVPRLTCCRAQPSDYQLYLETLPHVLLNHRASSCSVVQSMVA